MTTAWQATAINEKVKLDVSCRHELVVKKLLACVPRPVSSWKLLPVDRGGLS